MRHVLTAAAVLAIATVGAQSADPPPPTIEKLIEQLGSRSFAEREKATKLLRERGPTALAALRKARESKDEEVRKRVEVLIPPLEIEEALLPKRVTLKADGQALSVVLADVGKQTGFKLAATGKDDGKKVTADLRDVPFWEAIEKVFQQSDRALSFQQDDRSLSPVAWSGRSRFVSVRGPFRLEATWFHEDRDVDFTRANRGADGRRSHQLTLSVSVVAEPRLTFLKVRPAKVDEALDSEGKSLLEPGGSADTPTEDPSVRTPPPTPDVRSMIPAGRGTFRGESTHYSDVRLRRASESAKSVKVVRGTIPVRTILIRRPVVVTSKVLESGGTSFRAGSDSLHIKQVRNQGGGSIEVEIQVPREENGSYREWHERFSVEDEAGNKFQMNGRGSSSNGREYSISMYFSPPFNKNNLGAPAKLVFEDWVIHDHAIPFEFRDVPLP
jgi:hypothetical protein